MDNCEQLKARVAELEKLIELIEGAMDGGTTMSYKNNEWSILENRETRTQELQEFVWKLDENSDVAQNALRIIDHILEQAEYAE